MIARIHIIVVFFLFISQVVVAETVTTSTQNPEAQEVIAHKLAELKKILSEENEFQAYRLNDFYASIESCPEICNELAPLAKESLRRKNAQAFCSRVIRVLSYRWDEERPQIEQIEKEGALPANVLKDLSNIETNLSDALAWRRAATPAQKLSRLSTLRYLRTLSMDEIRAAWQDQDEMIRRIGVESFDSYCRRMHGVNLVTPDELTELAKLLDDPSIGMRSRAALILSDYGKKWAQLAAKAAATSDTRTIASKYRVTVQPLNSKNSVNKVFDDLEGTPSTVRFGAIYVADEIDVSLFPPLMLARIARMASNDPDLEVRDHANNVLPTLRTKVHERAMKEGDPGGNMTQMIENVLKASDLAPQIRKDTIRATSELVNDFFIETRWRAFIENPSDQEVADSVMWGLSSGADRASPTNKKKLLATFQSPDSRIRNMMVATLMISTGSRLDRSCVGHYNGLVALVLREGDAATKQIVLDQYMSGMRIGNKNAPLFLACIRDPDAGVRKRAIEIIVWEGLLSSTSGDTVFSVRDASDALGVALHDSDSSVKVAAAIACQGNPGDHPVDDKWGNAVFDGLSDAAMDQDAKVKKAAWDSLAACLEHCDDAHAILKRCPKLETALKQGVWNQADHVSARHVWVIVHPDTPLPAPPSSPFLIWIFLPVCAFFAAVEVVLIALGLRKTTPRSLHAMHRQRLVQVANAGRFLGAGIIISTILFVIIVWPITRGRPLEITDIVFLFLLISDAIMVGAVTMIWSSRVPSGITSDGIIVAVGTCLIAILAILSTLGDLLVLASGVPHNVATVIAFRLFFAALIAITAIGNLLLIIRAWMFDSSTVAAANTNR